MRVLKEQQDKRRELEQEKIRVKKECEDRLKELDRAEGKVYDAGIYYYKDIIPIICYLVSLVEGKEYHFSERTIPVGVSLDGRNRYYYGYVPKEWMNREDFNNTYNLQYIYSDEKLANQELDRKIDGIHVIGKELYDEGPIPYVKEMVTKPAENYVQIAIFSNTEQIGCIPGVVDFYDNDRFLNEEHFLSFGESTRICDSRFMYIIDFMHYLTVMKLEKEDFTLSVEEMMAYARDFAEEVKKQKCGQGNKILKRVIVEF